MRSQPKAVYRPAVSPKRTRTTSRRREKEEESPERYGDSAHYSRRHPAHPEARMPSRRGRSWPGECGLSPGTTSVRRVGRGRASEASRRARECRSCAAIGRRRLVPFLRVRVCSRVHTHFATSGRTTRNCRAPSARGTFVYVRYRAEAIKLILCFRYESAFDSVHLYLPTSTIGGAVQ